MGYRTIEIDFEIHRAIENERNGFDEHPSLALRRLLKLGSPAEPPDLPAKMIRSSSGRSWDGDGVILPHGTELRMTYNKKTYQGLIENGAWISEGRSFDSPSGAASGVGRTRSGGLTKLDGWIYWEVKRPGDTEWFAINTLRPSQSTALSIEEVLGL